MRLALKDSRLGLRNSTTRLPFRYGSASLTQCPQALLRLTIEAGGRTRAGFSGDCLPPSWFDKTPGKDFTRQIDDMLRAIADAQEVYADAFSREVPFFPTWRDAHEEVLARTARWGAPPLLGSFGSSLVERAMIDAACRLLAMSFARAVRDNLLGIDPGLVHPALAGLAPRHWLPAAPRTSVFIRHTVGLADPLTAGDIAPGDRLDDGWPQALEEYVEARGVRYIKVKVTSRLDADLDRLERVARVLERHRGADYRLTLDGNEQYHDAGGFLALVDGIRARDSLRTLWTNVLAIEQPFDRGRALAPDCAGAATEVSRAKPVIIDESDGTLDAWPEAMRAGYRGVSSKNCKGAIKSLLNAGLVWLANDRGRRADYVTTGEDLCSVGIVPVQSDLCLAATLGLTHVERNGHHYHPGLTYLPEPDRCAALAAHPDFYTDDTGVPAPRITDGRFEIRSIVECAGFGFAVEQDVETMTPAGSAGHNRMTQNP
jgi:hypothetical protein